MTKLTVRFYSFPLLHVDEYNMGLKIWFSSCW